MKYRNETHLPVGNFYKMQMSQNFRRRPMTEQPFANSETGKTRRSRVNYSCYCSDRATCRTLFSHKICSRKFSQIASFRSARQKSIWKPGKRTRYLCPCSSMRKSLRSLESPPSGMYHSLTVQSSEAEAMMLSLNGFHLMSSTGRLWPVTCEKGNASHFPI